ncbi:MAG: sulfatase [Nocardioides sp.]|uniref:sulfatase family protein n=1 Tax=Nocardioides sp. TaxID=35761 RepID=UPI003F074888
MRTPSRLLTALCVAALAAGCTTGPQAPRRHSAPHEAPRTKAPVPDPSRAELRAFPGTEVARPAFTAPEEQPNFLVLTTDDMAMAELELMPYVSTQLAAEGLTLTESITPTPLCAPSRASFLTGQYAHNHGVTAVDGPRGGAAALDDTDTLPVWLQEAGYDTAFVGKYLNGYGEQTAPEYVPPGWTEWRATVDPTTYDFLNHDLNVNGEVTSHPGEYSTTLLREQALDVLDDPARDDAPWLMWFNFVAPHSGHAGGEQDPDNPGTVPAEEDLGDFADLDLPSTPAMFEEDPSDKTLVPESRQRVDDDARASMRLARQRRAEALQSVDRTVEALVETLREQGTLDNTYVLFTSDNGFALGEHNMRGKLWHFDEMLRVPTVLRGPGLPAGRSVATPVSVADWAPTIAALAGAEAPGSVDGTNVVPWFGTRATHRAIPIAGWKVFDGSARMYSGVAVGPWTFAQSGQGRKRELYDRRADPYEISSLAADPRFRGWERRLARLSSTLRVCAGPSCQTGFHRVDGSPGTHGPG